MNPTLVFIEQFHYPEGWGGAELPRSLTMHLARNGFGVEVICGSDQCSVQFFINDSDIVIRKPC